MSLGELVQAVREHRPTLTEPDATLLQSAYEFAESRHDGQERDSKCAYFVHCYEVAMILAHMRMDVPTICAGLLHDVVEDTPVTQEELEPLFGTEIAFLVEGVTKLGALQFLRVEERQAENYRKMVVAMARDLRVIIIKLADRLHNMETIEYIPEVRQRRIAKETLEIYAPLAHRLGIDRMRTELEDLAFKVLEPEAYRDIAQRVQEKRAERDAYIAQMCHDISTELKRQGIEGAEVVGRRKSLYSIHRKITVRGVPFENIYDLVAFRVIVEEYNECYVALGAVHVRWTPMPDRITDYINNPKLNEYRSLHTTVIDHGRPVEIQIRTHEMQEIAEFGVAAHWWYKDVVAETPTEHAESIETFAWLRQLLDQIQDVRNPNEFLQSMEGELFDEEVFVFTPKGDMKTFRQGATHLDFAFAIHTDVGLRTTGAKANGRIVPLKSELHSGDIVEILTEPDARPSRDWLRIVKTSRARNKIKHWFREREFEQNVALGRRLIEAQLREHHLTPKSVLIPKRLEELAASFDQDSVETMLADVGNGQVSAQRVYHVLVPPEERDAPESDEPHRPLRGQMVDARLGGIDRTESRIAKCCSPVPGDDVVGYVTRGRGVTVHARSCARIAGEFERIMPIEWSSTGSQTYVTEIVVESNDRQGLVSDVTHAIAALGVSIQEGRITTPDVYSAHHHWIIKVTDVQQLDAIVHALMRVRGVRRVTRKRRG